MFLFSCLYFIWCFLFAFKGDEFVFVVQDAHGDVRRDFIRFSDGEEILMVAHWKNNAAVWDECSCFGESLLFLKKNVW